MSGHVVLVVIISAFAVRCKTQTMSLRMSACVHDACMHGNRHNEFMLCRDELLTYIHP
jgi:hypothetical protein